MQERKLDFLSRRPVTATLLVSFAENEYVVAKKLPENYLCDNDDCIEGSYNGSEKRNRIGIW